MQITITLGLNK